MQSKIFRMQNVDILYPLSFNHIHHEKIRWSNELINSPMCYSLLERRVMYYLTGEVKRKFVEKGLGVPENWKELIFYLYDKDIGDIGGRKNVPRTYEALCALGGKVYSVCYKDDKGHAIIGKIHWVDSFFYDKQNNRYAVRVSPEIMKYLINLTRDFTSFDIGTAMKLKSRFSQKMYEICCEYGGKFRYYDITEQQIGNMYKERVLPISMDSFRALFNLNEVRDNRTGKILVPFTYRDYSDIRRNILEYAQKELYGLYMSNASDLWFDFQAGPKTGIGGKISSIIIYIYTREHPKRGEQRPWKKGDDPLIPFEMETIPETRKTPYQKLHSNMWYGLEDLDRVVCQLLSRYLTKKEVAYYMRKISDQARNCTDCYTQVIQVIQEKENQKKFMNGTKQYKRNNIMDYVLRKNLLDYGWTIEPPTNRKDRAKQMDLFG